MLRINEINIRNINSVTSLHLRFQPGVNILCGTNGIGKTTILDCIHSATFPRMLSRRNNNIRKTVNSTESFYSIDATVNEQQDNFYLEIGGQGNYSYREINAINSRKLIYLNILERNQRNFSRLLLDDAGTLRRPISMYDLIKRWFYRCYFQKKDISGKTFENLLLAKRVFSKLDPNVTFVEAVEKSEKHLFRDTIINFIEIMVKTQKGTINMDFLSSGYKACFSILFGIIREIEEKYNIPVESFDGVVLIDEIDLHLHPEWQTKIIDILKWLIPNSQIIITTHSPHVIQNAKQGEIIPLGIDEDNKMFVRNLPESSKYGYQGWTIEEILVHVMGLNNPKSKLFLEKIKGFEKALDNEDIDAIKENYYALDEMLHSNNPLSTVLRIQADEFLEEEVDDE
ncbi:AAA family ATPase [Strepomyces sp. STD 3.1]|nr:AAA family ATPase [Streptomyces sp. STD 3.1]